jgi:uncharacterized membrane protein
MVNLKESIKKLASQFKGYLVSRKNKWKSWAKRHKKRIIIPLVIISVIALTTGLVLGAYSGVDITEQAVIINYT